LELCIFRNVVYVVQFMPSLVVSITWCWHLWLSSSLH